jgi:hypothetical protein
VVQRVRLRARTTVVRLDDDTLLLHSLRCAGRITGCYERVRVPPDVRKKISDKAAAARSLDAMLQRPARRRIVGHADVIQADCRDYLAQAWRKEGVDV